MKTKTLPPPPHYRTLSHTTTFAPPHEDAPATQHSPSDALALTTTLMHESIVHGDVLAARYYAKWAAHEAKVEVAK